jgi:hypothetical protein
MSIPAVPGPLGGYRPPPSPVPPNQGLIWASVEKPEAQTQTCCVLCLKDGTTAALEQVYIISGYSLCMKHTQDFFAARQSPENFIYYHGMTST